MALFEHGVCLGDSLTTGARSSYGLAEGLSSHLTERTKKTWMWRCEAVNGETILQLLRRMDQKPQLWKDVSFATVVIGTNDSKSTCRTSPGTYKMLYNQILDRLLIQKILVFPGLVPDVFVSEALASPYDASCNGRIAQYNEVIKEICGERGLPCVDTTRMTAENYSDGVHFSLSGIEELAKRFADSICKR